MFYFVIYGLDYRVICCYPKYLLEQLWPVWMNEWKSNWEHCFLKAGSVDQYIFSFLYIPIENISRTSNIWFLNMFWEHREQEIQQRNKCSFSKTMGFEGYHDTIIFSFCYFKEILFFGMVTNHRNYHRRISLIAIHFWKNNLDSYKAISINDLLSGHLHRQIILTLDLIFMYFLYLSHIQQWFHTLHR